MLTLRKKRHSSCDINHMKLYKYRLYIFCPPYLKLYDSSNNRLNHAVKEVTRKAH